VAGVAIMIGTVGLGSNLFSQPSQFTSSTSTPLYASATGSSTASCDSVTNACSLQTALKSVSSSTPNVTIMLITPSSTGDYVGGFTVNTGTSSSPYNVTIENYKSNAPVLNGKGASTVLTATGSGSLTLSGVTITGGQAENGSATSSSGSTGGAGANGGGINSTASLIVSNSTFTGNFAGSGGSSSYGNVSNDGTSGNGGAGGDGGAVYSTAPLAVSNSTFTGNGAGNGGAGGAYYGNGGNGGAGGGIYSTSSLTISKSTVSGNYSGNGSYPYNGSVIGNEGDGGGIYSTSSLAISKSTISGNYSGGGQSGASYNGGNGGGIYSTTSLTISNSTITGNVAGYGPYSYNGGNGGGVYSSTSLTISNSTISGNFAGRSNEQGYGTNGIGNDLYNGGAAKLTADLLAGLTTTNCAGTSGGSYTDGYNISSDGTCGFTNTKTSASETNLVSSSANNLNTLGNNGGPTQTIYPQSSNAAIKFIPVTSGFCPPTDQRGYVPPSSDTTCDAGAVQTGYAKYQALLNQTITFTSTAPTDPVVGDTYAPTAKATSGLPVSLSIASSSSSVCSFSSSVVSFTSTGTCTIDANQAGNSTYNPAPQVTQAITVVAAPKATTIPPAVRLVTGPPAPPATTTDALPLGLGLSVLGVAGVGYLALDRKRRGNDEAA
jgi:hypothetical protein